ncbi:MarR family winged helix-turn-helix transcriptional regulator [Cohnella thailandensis]|uniref:Winged helix-turn-helix transcriptional regulator n=1 Tax=Cohnella thailandensis TaxID=557557 RepID=A0A841SWF7_9BACL|nr:MarR family winged helix-turn-helix transcriptional regulator [Cohnella thailandensis]MBB6633061.1 winged helix-turn-helix transcriptional regulator [Cohnella thailandensis]MBP1975244.1 DNA-binding MarR family transcriptional regulator [Cohnella thailandensis]
MDQQTAAICMRIIDISNELSVLFLEDIKRILEGEHTELSTKQKILLELIRTGSRTVNEIAAYFSITPSAASQLVSKLEKQDYVTREINPNNRREIIVGLGEKGRQYMTLLDELQLSLVEKYYAKMPLPDLRKLLELNEKLYAIASETRKTD